MLLLTCVLVSGCSRSSPGTESRFPGPFTRLDRVEIGGTDGVSLQREGELWRIEGTPFLVDSRRARALERAFHHRWEPSEERSIEHTGEALHLNGPHAIPVVIVPSADQPVTYVQGRAEGEGGATWILPNHSDRAALVEGAPLLSADANSWRSEEVLGLDAALVTEIRLDPGLTAVRNDEGWVSETYAVDSYRVEQLVRRLASLDAELVEAVPATESSTQRFVLVTASATRTVAIHTVDDVSVLSVDGVIGFSLSESDRGDLELARRTLEPTERLAIVPERVVRLHVYEASQVTAFVQDEGGWMRDEGQSGPEQLDRWVRAVARLNAYYDAPEAEVAFTMPRRSVELVTEESTIRVDFVWRDGEEVYARIDHGLPFRIQRSAERILRIPLISDHSETTP